jgi:putative ABC transport system permease protein
VSGAAYLAWRYLLHHRIKTLILVLSIALIVFLPIGLRVLVRQSAAQLTARAEATPLVLGARGSALELLLASLYFDAEPPPSIAYAEATRVDESSLADAIPLHLGFRTRDKPIVGTTLEYFELRGLHVAAGRMLAVLGECVVGARAAAELGVEPGGALVSSPEMVFQLAGVYPLKMRVAGVLAPSHTPDDGAVFVDLKTAWIIAGLGHGHRDLADPKAQTDVAAREGGRITAKASLVEYNEITADNAASFHFHGEQAELPISAVLARPRDAKARAMLLGRYQAPDEPIQVLRPTAVMDELLETVVTVESYAVAAVGAVGVATLATAGLVFLLSIRLRRREIETLVKIGGSRASVATVLLSEVVGVTLLGIVLAGVLTMVTSRFGEAAIRRFLLS